MASRFMPSDIGASTTGSSFSTPLVFNSYRFRGALFGSGWENSSSDVREPAQDLSRAYIDWRYEYEAKALRELVRVESIELTPARPFINSNMSYPTRGHGFGYEQRNPFLGYPANASAVNSLRRQRQETGNFTGHENEVFSHYAYNHNRDLRGIRVLRNMKLRRWSQANVEGNFPIMKLPEADVENNLIAASRPESEIPVNIPLRCPEGSHEGKMPYYGIVNSSNVQIFHRPQASITKKLPSDNHSVCEILIKANNHDQKEEKGWRKENQTNESAAKGNFPIMKLPEADVENNLTAASRPESEIPVNIPLRHCPKGSHEGKMPCYGIVNSSNVQIFHRPQASITKKLPSDNHSVCEILIKANIHDQKDEKGWRKENQTNESAAKVLYSSVNSESHLLHQLHNIENSSPGKSVCSNGTALSENSKKRKRRLFHLRKSMKKKTHSALEIQSSIPCEKAVEELSCSFSKVGSTSLCSVEAHIEGKKHNAEGGSSIATKGRIKKVKDAPKKFKDGMKKVKNVKRVSKRRNHGRNFWCEMCNVEGINETLMLIHRNGRKHLRMLRKNRGAVLVVSSNQIDK